VLGHIEDQQVVLGVPPTTLIPRATKVSVIAFAFLRI